MLRLLCIAVASGLLMTPDVHQATQAQPQAENPAQIPAGQTIPVMPNFATAAQTAGGAGAGAQDQDAGRDSAEPSAQPGAAQDSDTHARPRSVRPKDDTLQEDSRLDILRNVSGEYARLVTTFPGGKKGFHIKAGEPIDQDALRKAIQGGGATLNSGDTVQITRIEFRSRDLMVELNGGGKGHTSWRDHVQMGVGGVGPVMTSSTTTSNPQQVPVAPPKAGATFYLEFDRTVPNMTSDELKRYLSTVLDFSKQRSASVQWASTLPPKVQEAIAEKRPDVGMDREEILAAMGRPDRKVRERDADGNDTEDWIYGHPPAKTIFVRFSGDKVIQIDQF
jgi:hypothetical protein